MDEGFAGSRGQVKRWWNESTRSLAGSGCPLTNQTTVPASCSTVHKFIKLISRAEKRLLCPLAVAAG